MQYAAKSFLVTRPEPENSLTCAALATKGASAIALPMMTITPITDPPTCAAIRATIFDLDLYDFIIFISKNAAREGAEWIDKCWPMLPENIHWLGIGQGTTKLLRELGIPAQTNLGQTTEDLLQWSLLDNLSHKKVLIMRGDSGRPELATQLTARGAKVSYVNLYQRNRPNYTREELMIGHSANVILITSGEGLANLNDLLEKNTITWRDKPIIAPSQRVAELAEQSGWHKVFQANGADDSSILDAIDSLQDI